jgi:pimeloyl-ACP methyl ester carboxylesterase
VRANLLSIEATKQRHLGTSPHPERIDPDTWTDEWAFLSRPGQDRIQLELFHDYGTNVAAYPAWQAYLRERHPPTLVVWGRYDPSFLAAGAAAFARDCPAAEIHVIDAGHFALDEAAGEVIQYMRRFLDATL